LRRQEAELKALIAKIKAALDKLGGQRETGMNEVP